MNVRVGTSSEHACKKLLPECALKVEKRAASGRAPWAKLMLPATAKSNVAEVLAAALLLLAASHASAPDEAEEEEVVLLLSSVSCEPLASLVSLASSEVSSASSDVGLMSAPADAPHAGWSACQTHVASMASGESRMA